MTKNLEYLGEKPIAVLGGGAVGKTCAIDIKLSGREVRLYDMLPYAEFSLKGLDVTGLSLEGRQTNAYGFERRGKR